MNDYFQQRIDETRQAYLDALERLKKGTPTNKKLVGKIFKINATTIALESGKSRNPLYNTHKDILEMIDDIITKYKKEETEIKQTSEIESLKFKIKNLEQQNKNLLNINATLLFDKHNERKE